MRAMLSWKVCVYIYIERERESQKTVQDLACFESKIRPRLSQKPVHDFILLVFLQFFIVFGGVKKHKGANIFFLKVVEVSKRGSKNAFLIWIKHKRKD